MSTSYTWIWQQPTWPHFIWQEDERLHALLRRIRFKQGLLLGKTGAISDELTSEAALNTLLDNIVSSSAIEGEKLNVESVRSSLAKRLDLHLKQAHATSKRSEGVAQIMLDAITNLETALSFDRLFQWHQWLFPDTKFSLYDIRIGQLRGEEPMQVVSGRIDKPKVHFEAPPREGLEQACDQFIDWFNKTRKDTELDPLIRAAITHFWFVTLHPFEDGNGRIGRALTDLALAQEDRQSIRLYSMSTSILAHRKQYYAALEKSSRGSMDITAWLLWFMETLEDSLTTALNKIDRTLVKTKFWQIHSAQELSAEQIKVLNRLLDEDGNGFEQGISAAQYQKIAQVSKATATRHLADLLTKECLVKLPGGGRSTRYQIAHSA